MAAGPDTEVSEAHVSTTAPHRESKVTVAVRFLPYALLVALVVLVTKVASLPVTNADTFFHIRFGQEFLSDWSLWNPGSVTPFATRDWVPTQWLGEVVLGWFDNRFGLAGVAWLTGLMILGYMLALFVVCRRRAGALAAVAVTIVAVIASSDGLSGRPQVLSYLFMALLTDAWLRTAEDGRPRWWLVGLAWVWPLVHGMWLLGIVTSVVAAAGVLIDGRGTLDRRTRRQLLALPVAMALAAALTPIGPKIWTAVAVVGSRGSYYTEWAAPDYQRPVTLLMAVLLAVIVVIWVRRGQPGWFPVLMLLVCAGWALYTNRTVPIAAAMAAPMAAAALGRLGTGDIGEATRRTDVRLAGGLVAAALVVLAVVVPFTAADGPKQPSWLGPELRALPAGTPVLATDLTGGYLMWAYPSVPILAHGYGDTFTEAELRRNKDLIDVAPGWETELATTGITHAVLPKQSSLAYALDNTLG
ncbi:MAG: hypothetical protein JWO46_1982, partial [Nocardioidaceae bacterium]|nr:hypothetical protein [Nocardioidaceae bacterium]